MIWERKSKKMTTLCVYLIWSCLSPPQPPSVSSQSSSPAVYSRHKLFWCFWSSQVRNQFIVVWHIYYDLASFYRWEQVCRWQHLYETLYLESDNCIWLGILYLIYELWIYYVKDWLVLNIVNLQPGRLRQFHWRKNIIVILMFTMFGVGCWLALIIVREMHSHYLTYLVRQPFTWAL